MCGLAGAWGGRDPLADVRSMIAAQRHRGPDAEGSWSDTDDGHRVALGHARLAIRDLSEAGLQPMVGELIGLAPEGRYVLCFNGEILNDAELRAELEPSGFVPRSASDAEVLLAAWARWGPECLPKLIGFFAFLLFDRRERALWAVRDRFGVKPLYLHQSHGDTRTLRFASEIGGLFADPRVPREPNPLTWSRYLSQGRTDEGRQTFWQGVQRVEAGTWMRIDSRGVHAQRWYDLPARLEEQGLERRDEGSVREELRQLLEHSVRLRFRSDVPVGINLSGGLDSSTLLALVHAVQGRESNVAAFHFATGDERYDELPWVEQMLDQTRHPLVPARISPSEVPQLASELWQHNLEPYGGLPTVAYAALFAEARRHGVLVLLDGQGIDEAWAGYDYYLGALDETTQRTSDGSVPIQGATDPLRRQALAPDFASLADTAPTDPVPTAGLGDAVDRRLLNLQLRDLLVTKLPRALRFNDRASMRASCELREPFLDHRLIELALRQPAHRKIEIRDDGGSPVRKAMVRDIARELLPSALVDAPKRPVQTPQREWLRGDLREWAQSQIAAATRGFPDWLRQSVVEEEWQKFQHGRAENGFFVWQWLTLGWLDGR